MKIKSIKLKNFRQFKDSSIEFSTDSERNVSIIMGENGSGKTTMEKAFIWCLYGENTFRIKSIVNVDAFNKLKTGESLSVEVQLIIEENRSEYIILRKQIYKKSSRGTEVSERNKLYLWEKNSSGETNVINETNEIQLKINGILPQRLSPYFFFDGERIEKLGFEITSGNKSYEFEEAIQGILGLDSALAAKDHLSPSLKNSVIRKYNDRYNTEGNKELEEAINKIKMNVTDKEFIEETLSKLRTEKENLEIKKIKLQNELKTLEKVKEYQNEREELEKKLKLNKKNEFMKAMIDNFNANALSYFQRRLIIDAYDVIKGAKITNKGIPDMRVKSIEHIINSGECICGENLKLNKEALKNLQELMDYLPPKALGISLREFIEYSINTLSINNDLKGQMDSQLRAFTNESESIDEINDRLVTLNKLISQGQGHKVQMLNNDLNEVIKKINDIDNKVEKGNIEYGKRTNEIEYYEKRKNILSRNNEENYKLEKYIAYAMKLHNLFEDEIARKENQLKRDLQDTMNSLFNKIYKGNLNIKIDDKYRVEAITSGEEVVEASTAQSVSIIFAFITSIIDLAKKFHQRKENSDSMELKTYPLVMDAPLSALDKKRIKSVSEVIPAIADQVIIFIKDTDGEIAEEHLKDKIGTKRKLSIESETSTIVI